METLNDFVKGLKKRLRSLNPEDIATAGFYDYGGETGAGYCLEVDWDALNKEIDAFCAEFQAKREQGRPCLTETDASTPA